VFDAERVRFAVEYVTRVANDFNSTNMFFVKNCSVLLIDVPPFRPYGIHSVRSWPRLASLHSDSVMSFETEELVQFRGRDPVSAYPLIRLTRDFRCSNDLRAVAWAAETFPQPFKLLDDLLHSLARL
jgi:hypothetical protein